MPKITKLSQLDPGIVALLKSDSDQDLILANNMMRVLKIRCSDSVASELNQAKEITLYSKTLLPKKRKSDPDKYITHEFTVSAKKYVYDYINASEGFKRWISGYYRAYQKEIDNFLRNEQGTV